MSRLPDLPDDVEISLVKAEQPAAPAVIDEGPFRTAGKVHVEPTPDALHMRWSWVPAGLRLIFPIFLALMVVGWWQVGGLFAVLAVPLIYASLAATLNQRHLSIGDRRVVLRDGPLPWPRFLPPHTFDASTDDLEGARVLRVETKSDEGAVTTSWQVNLVIVGRMHEVLTLPSQGDAYALDEALDRHILRLRPQLAEPDEE